MAKPVAVYHVGTGRQMPFEVDPDRLKFFPNLTAKRPRKPAKRRSAGPVDTHQTPPRGDTTERK